MLYRSGGNIMASRSLKPSARSGPAISSTFKMTSRAMANIDSRSLAARY